LEQLSLYFPTDLEGEPRSKDRMEETKIKRLYYPISEVSRITGLKAYVLRYWETEFPELRPTKNRAGNRTYRKSDIRTIFLIKKLLYHEKYTIEGARQRLKQIKKGDDGQLKLMLTEVKKEDLMRDIRQELEQCLKLLNEK
jgi:DNA-binding transcriptional MerR regulator